MTLAEFIAKHRFTVSEAVTVGLVLSRQLAASDRRFGHADPELFVLGADGFRVIDREQRQLARRGLPSNRAAAWFTPELIRGTTLAEQADVFCVALTVIGALCGRSPFLRDDLLKTLTAAMRGEWSRPLTTLRSGLPTELVEVLRRAADPDPLARPVPLELERRLAAFMRSEPAEAWSALVKLAGVELDARPVPDTEEARLVHADALEEQGLHDEARWVRLECHLMRASGEERAALQSTLQGLGAALGPDRLASLSRALIERCPLVLGASCPGSWERLEPAAGTRRRCHECGCTVEHVTEVGRAQPIVYDGGTVAIDVAAARTPGDLAIPDHVMERT
ncbi:MAG: hypothetical protein Q8S33_07140 [Myxococcales bacterium]|nr:hypothetical protein [Myxococcales bacterium]